MIGLPGTSLIAFATAAAIGCLASAAAALTPEEVKEKGTLVVGVLADFPPFGGTDANQQPVGFDNDIAALLAAKMGVKLEMVQVTGPNRIPYLLTNRIDMLIAALGINAERAKQVAFSNPYSTLDIMVMAPKSVELTEPAGLKNYVVGVTRAGSQDTFLSAVAPDGTDIRRFDDDAISLQAMISRQIEVLGGSSIHLAVLNRDHPELQMERKFPLHSQGNGIGLRTEDEAPLAYVNDFVAEIVANGELDKVHRTWFGAPLPELPPLPQF